MGSRVQPWGNTRHFQFTPARFCLLHISTPHRHTLPRKIILQDSKHKRIQPTLHIYTCICVYVLISKHPQALTRKGTLRTGKIRGFQK